MDDKQVTGSANVSGKVRQCGCVNKYTSYYEAINLVIGKTKWLGIYVEFEKKYWYRWIISLS